MYRVLLVWLVYPSFDFVLNFCFSLLRVAVTEEKVLYQLDEVRKDEDELTHLLKPSSLS